MSVDVVDETGRESALAEAALAASEAILAVVDHEHCELSVALVSDERMRELNQTWRGIDRTTDVLSFSQLEGAEAGDLFHGGDAEAAMLDAGDIGDATLDAGIVNAAMSAADAPHGAMLGDVIVSVDTLRRQATDGGWTDDEELVRLLLHGVLHLLGFDHEHEDDARRMRSEEERVVAALSTRGIACAWEGAA